MGFLRMLVATLAAVLTLGVLAVSATPAAAIVGGHNATQDYPGETAVEVIFPGEGTAHCTAQQVDPLHVITAAHCASDQNAAPNPVPVDPANVTVRIGSRDRTSGGQVATGKQVLLNPYWMWGYPTGYAVSDVAVIVLDHPVRMPAMKIGARAAQENERLRIIGWGLTQYPPTPSTTLPTILQQKNVRGLAPADCVNGWIGVGEICVSPGACFGDSGAPVMRYVVWIRQWVSLGIGSRETDEVDPCGGPTVYTDLTYGPIRTWIRQAQAGKPVAPVALPHVTRIDAATQARIDWLKPHLVR